MKEQKVLTYQQVLKECEGTRKHLLLGNGFSIACSPVFRYDDLYKRAIESGLSSEAQRVFQLLGTNDFEGVLRTFDKVLQVGGFYGALKAEGRAKLESDLERVKQSLVESVTKKHLPLPTDVIDERRKRCAEFIRPYWNTFTINYDLLLYWVTMQDLPNAPSTDCFGRVDGNLVFSSRLGNQKGIIFLHGALHLYVEGGDICKHSWADEGRPLIELVMQGLSAQQYPLFVAEGTADKKKEQIVHNAYLSYGWSKFERIENPLVTYGCSFSESDGHIVDSIVANTKLKSIYLGLFDSPTSTEAIRLIALARKMKEERRKIGSRTDLNIKLYDSKTAPVWDAVQPQTP